MTRMSFYTFIGYDIPMEPMGYPLQYRATKGMFENFLSTFIPETYQEELETISQRLFQLREQKAEIQEEVADLQEKINENQMAIIEMKNENEESQETIEFKQNRMKELDKMMFDSSRKLKWYEEMLSTEFATGIN
jgi:TolA-binding protein